MSFPHDTPDPFEKIGLPRRDSRGRPMLLPRGSEVRQPYTRASSLAGYLSGDYGLARWRMRRLAKGMADSPELVELASALPKLTNDREQDRNTVRDLDPLIEKALDAGGAYTQAAYGTVVHGHTEPDDDPLGMTVPKGPVPPRAEADVMGFFRKVDELCHVILATEVFIANDDLQAAGTFDHVVYVPGVGLVVADKKTGDLHPNEFVVQLAVYAYGEIYDFRTDERSPLAYRDGHGSMIPVRTDWGIIYHVEAHTGETKVYWVDLVDGLRRARLAVQVREARADEPMLMHSYDSFTPPPLGQPEPVSVQPTTFIEQFTDATTLDEVQAIIRHVNEHYDYGITTQIPGDVLAAGEKAWHRVRLLTGC